MFLLQFHQLYLYLRCSAAIQWKESAHASQGGRDFTVMRPALMDSMVMAACSHVCVWMEGCVIVPPASVIVPPDSQWVVQFGMIKLIEVINPFFSTSAQKCSSSSSSIRFYCYFLLLQGVHCESPCKSGTYGKNCSLECSCENFVDCSPIDGTCFCKEGKTCIWIDKEDVFNI